MRVSQLPCQFSVDINIKPSYIIQPLSHFPIARHSRRVYKECVISLGQATKKIPRFWASPLLLTNKRVYDELKHHIAN